MKDTPAEPETVGQAASKYRKLRAAQKIAARYRKRARDYERRKAAREARP